MSIDKIKIQNTIRNILIIVFIAIICFSSIFTKTINDLDEIWNYNCARNCADGLIPYKDFNMVSMPLLFIISGGILNLFGNQLIVMRILAVVLMTAIFFITYKILEKTTNKDTAFITLIIFFLMFKDYMCIDYNYATLLIAIILLYIELKHKNEKLLNYNFKYDFIVGLIAGISILFKQTTGIAIALACIGYKIFKIRKKEEFKTFIKIVFTRLLGVIIPIICFIIYLIINNSVSEFIDYTILGLKTFTNKKPYVDLIKNYTLLSIVVPLTILIMFIMLFFKKTKNEIYILFAYSVSSFIVTFPICDEIHFLIGSLVTLISIVYLFYDNVITNIINNKLKIVLYGIISFITIFLMLVILFKSINNINKNYVKVSKERELNHFIGIPEAKELKETINEIDNYILDKKNEGKKVYILDAEAAIYNIPLNIYNKDYDMFNKGNLGSKGEDGIIERINKEENAIYLIKKNNLNWQNPMKVREHIIDNLNIIGEISIFWIYEK